MSGKLTLFFLFLFGLVAFALAVPVENTADEKADPEVPSEEEVEADVPEEYIPEEDETLESDAADDEKAEDPLEDDKAEEETNDEADEQNDEEEDDQENEVAESEDPNAPKKPIKKKPVKQWHLRKSCVAKGLLCVKKIKKCRVLFRCCTKICRYRRVKYLARRCVRLGYVLRYGRIIKVCFRRGLRYVYKRKLICLPSTKCFNLMSASFRHPKA